MPHPILNIATTALAVLTLSACGDNYYYDGDGNSGHYSPAYDNEAPRSELIKNCKGKIKEKVRNRIGYGAKIDWGNTNVYNSGRHETTINGKGTARNDGRKYKLHYSCVMNRRDAYVRSARIDWDHEYNSGNGGVDWNQKAIHACKERIRYQANRNIHQQFNLDFNTQHVITPSKHRRHVTGQARVQGINGYGKISYDCKVHVNPLHVDSADYHWLKPLPAPNHSSNNYEDARHICKTHLTNQLHMLGYQDIKFISTSAHRLSDNKTQVDIQVQARIDGGTSIEHYECRANILKGKVLKMQRIWD